MSSAVMARILERTDLIVKRIAEMTNKEIKTHWGMDEEMSLCARVGKWVDLINEQISISSTLIEGNKKNHSELLKGKREENYPAIIREKFMAELRNRMNKSVADFTI